MPSSDNRVALRRAVSPRLLLVLVLGDVLGAGIYVLVGQVGAEVGGAIWSAFVAALVLALFTAGSYAELATKYPYAGGAALYAERAFGSPLASFMVAFVVAASGITSASTLARAFGGDYLAAFVDLPLVPVAIGFLVLIAALNYRGILGSVRVNVVLTLVEVTGLALIAVIGVAAVTAGEGAPHRAIEFRSDASVPLAVLAGAAIAFYALIGFEDSVNLAEEAEHPTRAYPRALIGGLVIAGLIYLFVTVICSMAVPTGDLAASSGPLVEVAQTGPLAMPPRLFSAIGLLAIANGALINMIMVSRLLYGMAQDGIAPSFLGKVHPLRRTPWAAIVCSTAVAIALAATGDLETLARTTVVLLLAVFVVVNIAVLVLRRDRVPHEHFVVPRAVPIMGAAACLIVLTQTSVAAWGRVGILFLAGIGLWCADRLVTRLMTPRSR